MEDKKNTSTEKLPYVEPKVLATYEKEELQEAIKPHGPTPDYGNGCAGGGGCGCGGGSIL